jgi:hypothetical protein
MGHNSFENHREMILIFYGINGMWDQFKKLGD